MCIMLGPGKQDAPFCGVVDGGQSTLVTANLTAALLSKILRIVGLLHFHMLTPLNPMGSWKIPLNRETKHISKLPLSLHCARVHWCCQIRCIITPSVIYKRLENGA